MEAENRTSCCVCTCCWRYSWKQVTVTAAYVDGITGLVEGDLLDCLLVNTVAWKQEYRYQPLQDHLLLHEQKSDSRVPESASSLAGSPLQ